MLARRSAVYRRSAVADRKRAPFRGLRDLCLRVVCIWCKAEGSDNDKALYVMDKDRRDLTLVGIISNSCGEETGEETL